MTNIHNPLNIPMTVPQQIKRPPVHGFIRSKLLLQLVTDNPDATILFNHIIGRMQQSDDIIKALSIDLSFVKDIYHRNTYSKHIKYLSNCHIIVKTGTKNSWTYLVNPELFHCLRHDQRLSDLPQHNHLFQPIVIVQD